jgi:hypothetical protein
MSQDKTKNIVYQEKKVDDHSIFDENLNILKKKYQQYKTNEEFYHPHIEEKNMIIDDLKEEISKLKKEMINLTLDYNKKIDDLRFTHKKELLVLKNRYENNLS